MTLPNNISSFCPSKYFLTILFCVLGSSVLFGQTEKERVSQDLPKYQDGTSIYENPEANFQENKGDYSIKLQPNKSNSPASTLRKDNPLFKQGGDKDTKKEGMSTLSFNLFLYIVDKFKEDTDQL
jgi:hypothetical protein